MGNIPGLPDFPAEDIARIAGDVMTVFSPMYLKTYPSMLVKHAKLEAEARASPAAAMQLREPPIPSEPLLSGEFEKRGAVRLNWKKRYFVANNRADNFVVHYFAQEADKGDLKKAKGEMKLDGYDVQRVKDPEEQAQLGCGEFGVKMTCGRRRTWIVRFPDEELLKNWEAIFKNAARHARPPMNPDPVLRDTFMVAYHRLRWHYSYWSWWTPAGTEEEMLAMLVVDECNRECMGPVYYEIGRMSPTLRRKAESKVQELLDKTIGAVVASSWKAAMAGVNGMKEPVESKVKESLSTVLDHQVQFKNQIRDGIMSTVTPILEKIANPVLEPVMTHLLDPIFEAFVKNMEIFATHMQDLGTKDSSEFENEIKRYLRASDWYYGYMWNAYTKLHALTRSDGMQILSELCSGIYRWTIEDRIEDELKRLQKRALFTFYDDLKREAAEPSPDQFAAVLASTMEKFAHDSRAKVQDAFVAIMMDGLSPPLKREVVPAVQEIISPISDAIPDFLKDMNLLDLDAMLEDLLLELLEGACNVVVAPSVESRASSFDSITAGSV